MGQIRSIIDRAAAKHNLTEEEIIALLHPLGRVVAKDMGIV